MASPSNGSQSHDQAENLTNRMRARVATARATLERRAGATRPKAKRRPPEPKTSVEDRETASLKRVFRELGLSYRRYRRETGEPVEPGLRDAAYAFRGEPSLTSLVAVAAYLDELDILS